MRIGVIGCGHVGLVTGACLAHIGHSVVCTDNDLRKIDLLKRAQLPFYEPHLGEIMRQSRDRLVFSPGVGDVCQHAEAILICVGTPPLGDGDLDLSSIDKVARSIAEHSSGHKLVIEKSTVPVRSGQRLARALEIYRKETQARFDVASNPEFLQEGTAIRDFLHPDRIVVGVANAGAHTVLRDMYRPILESDFNCPIHTHCPPRPQPKFLVTDMDTAELIKHASNSFLALKISYINAVADVCELFGANVEVVAEAMGLDPRIGPDFLRPGLGFGGFCLPKDIQAFRRNAEKAGYDFGLLREVERINQQRVDRFLEKVHEALWTVSDKQIGALGLAFKPNTDDVRFAPSLEILARLKREGAVIKAFDPQATENCRAVLPEIVYCDDPYETAGGSEALLLLTEWPQFRELDWKRIHDQMARPLLIDGRNVCDPSQMDAFGFEYVSIGRPTNKG